MSEAAGRGGTYADAGGAAAKHRYDLANLRIQRYGDCAIASYTILLSTGAAAGVTVNSHNESREMVKRADGWQVVHVHKSPAWNAPYQAPGAK